jgi:SAM-dependent methyltransferase
MEDKKIAYDNTLKSHIIEWDIPNWSRALEFWQPYLDTFEDKKNVKVLAVGERNGGLTLWLALQGFKVLCTDYEGITPAAREMHKKYKVDQLITYEPFNIFEGKYADGSFDLVICKSVIGGLKKIYSDRNTRTLEGQTDAVREIHRMLKKGGYFLGAENMRGSFVHRFIRKKLGKDKGWRPFTVEEINHMLAAFSEYQLKFYGFLGVFRNNSLLNSLSNALNTVVNPLLPLSTRYICFFAARK